VQRALVLDLQQVLEPGAGAAGAGSRQQAGPWFAKSDYAFDEPTRNSSRARTIPTRKTALSSLRHADELARSRNIIEKPDPTKIKEWNGFTELGWNSGQDEIHGQQADAEGPARLIDDGAVRCVRRHRARQQGAAVPGRGHLERRCMSWSKRRPRMPRREALPEKRKLDQKLRTEWGADYDAKIAGARRAFAFLGGEDFNADEISAAIGSPRTAKLFAKLHELIGEDQMPAPGAAGSGPLSPNSAKAERLGSKAIRTG
jgi:hypothetical protein